MYIPPAFKDTELASIHETMRGARLASFVTCTASGLVCTPLPLFLDEREGEQGVIYGHLAKANTQWSETPTCDALAIFNGPDAYVTPSWYQSKKEHGKVVPTWNYITVHVRGHIHWIEDAEWLRAHVGALSETHEAGREQSWSITDAPSSYIDAMVRAIVGFELKISRLEGKYKLSQNRDPADHAGARDGLARDGRGDVAKLMKR